MLIEASTSPFRSQMWMLVSVEALMMNLPAEWKHRKSILDWRKASKTYEILRILKTSFITRTDLEDIFLVKYQYKQKLQFHMWHLVGSVPVSAMPMLRMVALCFCGKSSGAALKLKVPSSFFTILKIRMVSPLANHVINALQWTGESQRRG